ncbi:TIGR02444 family protein [Vibrio hippocampi]|uniref:TIGR02444 family protein n=1 Tax=Vibrio hippocampi TaxID=654686 RepID=A0ABM8ZFB4_9VIBR|nr:TIGR02444 family protein [Vibrio hippocampi]CAH0524568.1 hypothetical protein VHP8226_00406 [Vibrio hippocampi]
MTTTTQSKSLTHEALWQFSLAYYAERGVKEACLSLQNHYHGNVNLLLLLKWLDVNHLAFTLEQWPQVKASLDASEQLLAQYRQLRKQLKTQVTDTLYREALNFELSLEQLQQSHLIETINSLPLATTSASHLVDMYCQELGADHLCQHFDDGADTTK